MLTEVLGHLHNYFVVSAFPATYTIEGGSIHGLPSSLLENQYIRIAGSALNDGVYKFPIAESVELADEVFDGCICGLAIPRALLVLVDEIGAWCASDAGKASGYTSESFGGYSYNKATDASGAPASWQSVFRSRLNQWRKI